MPRAYFPRKYTHLQWLIDALKIETDECQEWPFRRNKLGYGYITINGKPYRVHRQALELLDPDFDRSLHVLHKCDNPPCFNKRHLFLGTQADNMADMIAKGRKSEANKPTGPRGPNPLLQGELGGNAKLTELGVIEIRRRWASGENQTSIAADTGISQTNISQIVLRKTWRHI